MLPMLDVTLLNPKFRAVVLIYIGEPDSEQSLSQSLTKGLWARQAMPSARAEELGC